MENLGIKIGDYIEGQELWGNNEKSHKMRIIVSEILEYDNHTVYRGKADDPWGGARGGYVSTELGEVKILTDEKPFTKKWWEEEYNKRKQQREAAWVRDWKPGDLVVHFKGDMYRILHIGVDTETEQEVIIYQKADRTGNIWVRPRKMFEGKVDKEKYPECLQTWRFELFEETK